MAASPRVLAVALLRCLAVLRLGAAWEERPRHLQGGECNFTNEPAVPHFWDPRCRGKATLGCRADGVNEECRFCGAAAYVDVYCPASWCEFPNPPRLPYYWDGRCTEGTLGCLADGKHLQCRFCGEFPYNGSVACPPEARAIAPEDACKFDNEPSAPHYWDATCVEGMLGCKADGEHIGCRFCGSGNYAAVNCPATLCTFAPNSTGPAMPYRYYWEPRCWSGPEYVLGCRADGIHPECRFCGGGEYESISCPAWSS